MKDAGWSAVGSLGSAPRDERTISGLAALVQNSRLKAALEPYTLGGPWGRLLDAERDDLDEAKVQGFEMDGAAAARQRGPGGADLPVSPDRAAARRLFRPDRARRGLGI